MTKVSYDEVISADMEGELAGSKGIVRCDAGTNTQISYVSYLDRLSTG